MNKICVIIPAFNAEATLANVIQGVSKYIEKKNIIIVDDGSSDATFEIAKKNDGVVLKNPTNEGKGFSLKKGYLYAIKNNFQAVICLDADMQHTPDDIPLFLDCYNKSNVDFILGNRMFDVSSMPWDRQFSNQTTSLIITLFTGQRIRDSQSGFRLIKTHVLRKIKLVSNRYETESELLVKALKSKYKFAHVPIKTIYNDQPSHINRLIDTWRFVRIVVLSLLN
ncbi:glycosyltransferase family 2 protein [candidate division KSB1 bacterium]|nr:glycosyltransferase family 2 protein [candidate division KSB1 bacterium]MBL7093606.1 glycosyltransferase family 2 protein [candidate division KSB1 bacterium]